MATNNVANLGTMTNHGIFIGQGTSAPVFTVLTNGQLLIGNTGNDPTAATLSAGAGISITNGAGTITIATSGGGLTWTDVTSTSATMAVENGYIADNAGLVTLTMPTTAAIGDVIHVLGKGAGGWTIVYGASQIIHFGNTTTTVTSGSLSSTNQWDCVTLRCVTANTTWTVQSAVGNLTVA